MKVKLNIKETTLAIVFFYTLFAYCFNFINFNFPLALMEIFLICYFLYDLFIRRKIYLKNSFLLKGYIAVGIMAVVIWMFQGINSFSDLLESRTFTIVLWMLFFINFIDEERQVQKVFYLLDIFYFLNFVLVLFQQFILGVSRDEIAGIFGVVTGNHGFLNIFLCLYTSYILVKYFYKKDSFVHCFAIVSMALYQAAISELKIYFVELALIVFVLFLMTKFDYKKVLFSFLMFAVFVIALETLSNMYSNFEGFFTIENMLKILTDEKGYTGTGDVNRLNGIFILQKYLSSEQLLFGLGVGNVGETSSFYESFYWLHYSWFTYTSLLLEVGIVGFGIIIFSSVMEIINAFIKSFKSVLIEDKIIYTLTFITYVVFLIHIFYNAKILTVSGSILFAFFFALPIINKKISEGGVR